MRRVIFSKDIKNIKIKGLPHATLIVVHEMYDAPSIAGTVVPWQEFKGAYTTFEADQYVIVGANRMISPSNRCDMVNDFLQVMTKTVDKISIDTDPFIGEPWRLWYHYSLAFGEWLGVDYSYPVEGDWSKWFFYDRNHCDLSADNLKLVVKSTQCDLEPLTTMLTLRPPAEDEAAYYEEIKKIIFNKYDTPKLLINNILKLSNKHFNLDVSFNTYKENESIVMPNLGVYRFMKEENERRKAIYNFFAKRLYE